MYRPELPKREPQSFDTGALTVGPTRHGSAGYSANPYVEGSEASDERPATAQLDEAWLQDRLTYEEQPDNAVTMPTTTRKWDETIR